MYNKVIVLGTGLMPLECLKLLQTRKVNLLYIEPEKQLFSSAKAFCKKNNIEYLFFEDKINITEYLLKLEEQILLISCHHKYIFPKQVLSKTNLFCINYHSGLLPKYRGVHSHTWAIFNNDKYSGVTWHIIRSEIDSGEIIKKAKILIKDTDTAFSLTEKAILLGINLLKEIIDSVLSANIMVERQNEEQSIYYKGNQIPNNGIFALTNDYGFMSRLLRATDYGKFTNYSKLKIVFNNSNYRITDYELNNTPEKDTLLFEDGILKIILNNKIIKLKLKIYE